MDTPFEAPFRIRRARLEDMEDIRMIHAAAIRSGGADVYSAEVIETWVGAFNPDSFPDNIRRMDFRVAELSDGRLGAFVALDLEGAELESLYVAPWAGGMGAGSYLLGFAEEVARQAALDVLWLDSSLNAVPFYARHGWEKTRHHARTRHGVEIPVVRMEKSLRG